MNVKWLRRLELTAAPAMTYYESRTYAPILPGGKHLPRALGRGVHFIE